MKTVLTSLKNVFFFKNFITDRKKKQEKISDKNLERQADVILGKKSSL